MVGHGSDRMQPAPRHASSVGTTARTVELQTSDLRRDTTMAPAWTQHALDHPADDDPTLAALERLVAQRLESGLDRLVAGSGVLTEPCDGHPAGACFVVVCASTRQKAEIRDRVRDIARRESWGSGSEKVTYDEGTAAGPRRYFAARVYPHPSLAHSVPPPALSQAEQSLQTRAAALGGVRRHRGSAAPRQAPRSPADGRADTPGRSGWVNGRERRPSRCWRRRARGRTRRGRRRAA